MSIAEMIEDMKLNICDNYCKYPCQPIPEGKDENWLFEDGSPCDDCPLNIL